MDNQIKGPIDITNYCLPNHTNVLRFWMSRPDIIWSIPCAFEISLVKCHTSEDIFQKIMTDMNNYIPIGITKAMSESIIIDINNYFC